MQENESTGIAIIGMSCRMPGAGDTARFWENLLNGVEAVRFLTPEDLVAAGLDPAMLQHPAYVNAAIRLEYVDLFDASFFGFSPREAELLDPQQRLFLECAWEALENAGCDPSRFPGLIGVYAGVNASHYAFNLYANPDLMQTMGMFQISVANDKDHISTRTAYKLDLRGPAITIQTTCSTSLVAICQASQSLLNYQCDVALAGASSILLNQNGYIYQEEGIPSPDGHCRAFDATAKGTVGGSGVGVVALKRLDEAIRDRDPIRAVIRGFGVNNDGAVKVGYTAPGIDGQAMAISTALAMGEIDPESVSYVEAHGTGTPLGDPIEVTALTRAFREAGARRNQYCRIGSVKTNIGHLDPAAGVAGLIKTVLALENEALPPSLHFNQPNPNIDFANSPFLVNGEVSEWRRGESPRRAGVSSFGIGGTNAHVVVEEAPRADPGTVARPWQILVLSARSESAVDRACANLATWIRNNRNVPLSDVAWTLETGRRAFDWRRIVVCPEDAHDHVIAALEDTGGAVQGRGESPPVAFVFTGQGAQYPHMGAELYRRETVFRDVFDTCAGLLEPHLDGDLREIVHPASGSSADAAARLAETAWAQPALFAIEYSLARQWQHWGIRPESVAGHSIGEFVAACLAEVFTLEDALALVAARGRLMQSMPPGAMLSVTLSEESVAASLPDGLSIAAVNAPSMTVVSGPIDRIESFRMELEGQGIGSGRLETSHAFHSSMMEPILESFAQQVGVVGRDAPRLPMLSNVTGDWITDAEAVDPAYWARHVRAPVRFMDNIRRLVEDPARIVLEVGPRPVAATLAGLVAVDRTVVYSLPAPGGTRGDVESMLRSLGRLWQHGVGVNWEAFHEGERRRLLALPTYPFERRRYWIDPPKAGGGVDVGQVAARDPGQWVYAASWDESPVPGDEVEEALAADTRNWLILGAREGLAHAVRNVLERAGKTVVHAAPGNGFRTREDGTYEFDPSRSADYSALLETLSGRGESPGAVVHLLCHGLNNSMPPTFAFWSLLHLANAIEANRGGRSVEVLVAADQLHASAPGAAGTPSPRLRSHWKSGVTGLMRVIRQEYPRIRCRGVDIEAPSGDGGDLPGDLAFRLVTEAVASGFEPAVDLRGGERRVERWRPFALPAQTGVPPRLREKGVYIITGGMGQIGMRFAEYLAKSVAARIVLIGRTAFPPRRTWEEVRRGGDEAISTRIGRILDLERHGAQVLPIRADIADADETRAAVGKAIERFGPIHGVIHAAGNTGSASKPLGEIDAVHADAHFRSKVDGLLHLDNALEGQPLDFVILMSSLSAILGGLGFGAYAAANSCLDAYAARRNREQFVRWISVNWDGWDFSEAAGGDYLLPDEGVDILDRILHRRVERLAVSVRPLDERVRQWVYMDQGLSLDPTETASAREPDTATGSPVSIAGIQHHERPVLSTSYLEARNDTETAVVAVWEDLLGIRPIGVNDNYFELGGHSLLAIQIASRLHERFAVKVAVQTLFEAPTPAELAGRIESELGRAAAEDDTQLESLLSELEQLSDEEVRALLNEDEG